MKINLVTCEDRPAGTDDDALLAHELRRRGHDVTFSIWNSQLPETDLVVIRSTWDYQRHLPQFLEWARKMKTLVNPVEAIEWNSSKRYLANLPHALESHFDGITLSGRTIVKPTVSATAELTFKCETREDQQRAIDEISRAGREPFVQAFVESIATDGEISLVYFGGKYSHALRKIPKPGDFRVQQDFGGTLEIFTPTTEHKRIAAEALESAPCGVLAYARVDLVDFVSRPRIGELELIEPELFFRLDPAAASRAADALDVHLGGSWQE